MKQVNKITLFYNDGTYQDIFVPVSLQHASIPTVFTTEKQLLQEMKGLDSEEEHEIEKIEKIVNAFKKQTDVWSFPKFPK